MLIRKGEVTFDMLAYIAL